MRLRLSRAIAAVALAAAACTAHDEAPVADPAAVVAFCTSAREATRNGFEAADLKAAKDQLDQWIDQLAQVAQNAPDERASRAADELSRLAGRARTASGAEWIVLTKDAAVRGTRAFATLLGSIDRNCRGPAVGELR